MFNLFIKFGVDDHATFVVNKYGNLYFDYLYQSGGHPGLPGGSNVDVRFPEYYTDDDKGCIFYKMNESDEYKNHLLKDDPIKVKIKSINNIEVLYSWRGSIDVRNSESPRYGDANGDYVQFGNNYFQVFDSSSGANLFELKLTCDYGIPEDPRPPNNPIVPEVTPPKYLLGVKRGN